MSQGFLQSEEWLGFQKSIGREVFGYSNGGISAKVIRHDLPFKKNYLYIPHGPQMDFNQMTGGIKNSVRDFVKWLHEEGKKRKSIFVKSEPLLDSVAQVLSEYGFKKSKKTIQPAKTVVIDLTKKEEELLSAMHHKTRYNIGVADRRDVRVTESDDINHFLKLLQKTAKRDKFYAHPADYYRKLIGFPSLETKLYFAKHGDKVVAASLVLIYDGAGYYLHGASDHQLRSFMAPYALHWQVIKQLKTNGLSQYNLWGIDSRKWPGVTRFKLGFGGRVVEYPGSFDLTISWFWHMLYKTIRR